MKRDSKAVNNDCTIHVVQRQVYPLPPFRNEHALFADQMIMSAILPAFEEYGASETTLASSGPLSRWWLLRQHRIRLSHGQGLAQAAPCGVILLGDVPCIMTGVPYFTGSIESFTVLRILTGIGLGGIFPLSSSILADYFKEEHRATASAWMTVAWSVGGILGVMVAGYLTNIYGWRLSFILVGAPNIPVAIFFALYAREPERGRTEEPGRPIRRGSSIARPSIR